MNLAKSTESRNAAAARTARPIAKVGVVAATSGKAANDPVTRTRAIDPVLLIHNERAESFRLLAQGFRRVFRALVGQSPSGTAA